MGYWPERPVVCPECEGAGQIAGFKWLRRQGFASQPSLFRCDICHGLGKIEPHEADAWARSQGPDPRDAAEDEANNRCFQGYDR